MKRTDRLGWFITFILLSAAPKKRAVTVSEFTHIQPAIPDLLPLTRFLKNMLDRVREHQSLLLARDARPAEQFFRIGSPEYASGEKEAKMHRSITPIQLTGNARAHVASLAITFLFLLAMSLIVPNSAKALNLVQNPGFETGDLTNWYLTGDAFGMHVGSDDPHSGTYAFDAGPSGAEGYLNQDFSGLGKNQYNLQFWVDQRNLDGNLFEVQWDGQSVYQLNNYGKTGYKLIQINGLQGSGATDTLTFGFIGGDPAWSLDDVALEQAPEPGSLMLLGTGVVGLVGSAFGRLLGTGRTKSEH